MLNYDKYQEIFSAHSHMYTLAGVSIILLLFRPCLTPGYEKKSDPENEVGVHVNASVPDAF